MAEKQNEDVAGKRLVGETYLEIAKKLANKKGVSVQEALIAILIAHLPSR